MVVAEYLEKLELEEVLEPEVAAASFHLEWVAEVEPSSAVALSVQASFVVLERQRTADEVCLRVIMGSEPPINVQQLIRDVLLWNPF